MVVDISFRERFPFDIGGLCHLDTDIANPGIYGMPPVWRVESLIIVATKDSNGNLVSTTECDIVTNQHGMRQKDRVTAARLRPLQAKKETPADG